MFKKVSQYRVAYADTDKMGFVYYGNYLTLFERARTELLRPSCITYKELEDSGVGMPVVEAHLNYHAPAHYDDILDLYAQVTELKGVRITIECQIKRNDTLLVDGYTTLAFMDFKTGRPVRISQELRDKLTQTMNNSNDATP